MDIFRASYLGTHGPDVRRASRLFESAYGNTPHRTEEEGGRLGFKNTAPPAGICDSQKQTPRVGRRVPVASARAPRGIRLEWRRMYMSRRMSSREGMGIAKDNRPFVRNAGE